MRSLIYSGREKKRRTCVSVSACVCVCVEGSSKTRVPGEIEVFSVLLCKTGTSWALFTHSICRGLKKIIYSAFRELINQLLAAQSIPQLWGNQLSELREAADFTFQLSWIFLVGLAWEKNNNNTLFIAAVCRNGRLRAHQNSAVIKWKIPRSVHYKQNIDTSAC